MITNNGIKYTFLLFVQDAAVASQLVLLNMHTKWVETWPPTGHRGDGNRLLMDDGSIKESVMIPIIKLIDADRKDTRVPGPKWEAPKTDLTNAQATAYAQQGRYGKVIQQNVEEPEFRYRTEFRTGSGVREGFNQSKWSGRILKGKTAKPLTHGVSKAAKSLSDEYEQFFGTKAEVPNA